MTVEDSAQKTVFIGLGLSGVRAFTTFVNGLHSEYQNRPDEFFKKFTEQPLDITLIDNLGEIGGLAYSRDRSPPPLLIHNSTESLSPFMEFQAWLAHNKDRAIAYLREFGDGKAERWIEDHENDLAQLAKEMETGELTTEDFNIYARHLRGEGMAVEDGMAEFGAMDEDWRGMRIPRALYGLFLHDEIGRAVAQLEEMREMTNGLVGYQVLQAEIEDIQPEQGDRLSFRYKDGEARRLHWEHTGGGLNPDDPAGQNLIGVTTDNMKLKPEADILEVTGRIEADQLGYFFGLPTPDNIEAFEGHWYESYFPNMYYHQPPGEQNSFELLTERIVAEAAQKPPGEKVEITVLGNRASAADLWVWTHNEPQLTQLAEEGKIVFRHISMKGEDGVRPAGQHKDREYDGTAFAQAAAEAADASALFRAYKHEIDRGRAIRADGMEREPETEDERRYSRYDILTVINPILEKKLASAPDLSAEWHGREPYTMNYAALVTMINFLTAPETIAAKDFLEAHGALEFVKGTFMVEDAAQDVARKWSVPLRKGGPVTGDIVVNTAGFGKHNETTANLRPLFESGLVTMNDMGVGLALDPETLRAAPDPAKVSGHPNFFINGITLRGGLRPYREPMRGTAAGNQGQLDDAAQAIAGKMLENLGVETTRMQDLVARSRRQPDAEFVFMR